MDIFEYIMTPAQKEGMQRIIDRKWDSLQTIASSMKEAEFNTIKFLFTMNGAGILGILTFLGTFHNIEIYSFIWTLGALLLLVSGLLLTAYLILRIMKMDGRNGQYLAEHLTLNFGQGVGQGVKSLDKSSRCSWNLFSLLI